MHRLTIFVIETAGVALNEGHVEQDAVELDNHTVLIAIVEKVDYDGADDKEDAKEGPQPRFHLIEIDNEEDNNT